MLLTTHTLKVFILPGFSSSFSNGLTLLCVCGLDLMKCDDFRSLVPSTYGSVGFFLNYDLFDLLTLFLVMSAPLNKGTNIMYLLRNRLECQSDNSISEQYLLNVSIDKLLMPEKFILLCGRWVIFMARGIS